MLSEDPKVVQGEVEVRAAGGVPPVAVEAGIGADGKRRAVADDGGEVVGVGESGAGVAPEIDGDAVQVQPVCGMGEARMLV